MELTFNFLLTLNFFNPNHQTCFLFTLLAAFLLIIFYVKLSRRRLQLPPGPHGVPLLGNLPFLDPELHTYFTKLGKKYGSIVKLQLGRKICIIVNSPSVAHEVLKVHDITFANRDVPQAGRVATYGGFDITWTPYGPEWRMLRKVCAIKMLSNASLDTVYELRRREVRNTVAQLYPRAGSVVNVGEQGFLTVFNVITSMLWGGSTLEGNQKEAVAAEFRKMVSDMTELVAKPNISDFFPCLAGLDLQGIEKQMLKLVTKLDSIFDKMIDERLRKADEEENRDKNDFLQFLLKVKDESDSKTPLTMVQLKALLMDMVIGGTDTSSNTIEFAMAEIMKNPKVAEKAMEELTVVVGKQSIVEESHIQSLPYLKAVMKETLRLHPILPLLAPHCPSQTTIISNYTIPKVSRVFVNVWAIQRDPNHWENPLEFDPERFLNGKFDIYGSDFRYFPFGSGRRNCAGISMAERMVMYLLATLLHSFDWKLKEGKKIEIEEKFGIVLKMKKPLVLIPTPRLSNPTLYR
ncbi:flavonoid 3'-monooxygenase CYP75B137-like [Benincasa hispida]|uniref:flavonoid 3'-monooxygenase CYP75B137-like n=1 Tax=Benincasa hispida TaxID=102211 RepID=UPI0019005143|nr:flavonoid 3'-monooxygenase CYP75B137-like [Benincasa hispida]